jgi:hypothetical protein
MKGDGMRWEDNSEWRSDFAIWPVWIGRSPSDKGFWVWLEPIEYRKAGGFEGHHVWSKYVFRLPVVKGKTG